MVQHFLKLLKIPPSMKELMAWLGDEFAAPDFPVQHFLAACEENSILDIFLGTCLQFIAEKLSTSLHVLVLHLGNHNLILKFMFF